MNLFFSLYFPCRSCLSCHLFDSHCRTSWACTIGFRVKPDNRIYPQGDVGADAVFLTLNDTAIKDITNRCCQ